MGSQTLSILRQGIWASITGGWYYDPRQSHASNIFHLYIWLLLLCLPIGTQIIVDTRTPTPSAVLWLIYCIVITVVFVFIKITNVYLHNIFDAGECVVEEEEEEDVEDPSTIRRPENPSSKDVGYELLPMSSRIAPSPTLRVDGSSSLDGPPAYLLARILSHPGTHLSHAHDDTTAGAVHCFQDEFGNWLTYTFDENGLGTARVLGDPTPATPVVLFNRSLSNNSSSSSSNSPLIMDAPTSVVNVSGHSLPHLPSRRHSSSNLDSRKKSLNVTKAETTVSLEVYPKPSKSSSSSSSGPSPLFTAPIESAPLVLGLGEKSVLVSDVSEKSIIVPDVSEKSIIVPDVSEKSMIVSDVSEKSISLKNSGLVSLSEEDIPEENDLKECHISDTSSTHEVAMVTPGTNNLSSGGTSSSASSAVMNLDLSRTSNIVEEHVPSPWDSLEGAVGGVEEIPETSGLPVIETLFTKQPSRGSASSKLKTQPVEVGERTQPVEVGERIQSVEIREKTQPVEAGGETQPVEVGEKTEPVEGGEECSRSVVRRRASNEGSGFQSFISDSLEGYSPHRSGGRVMEHGQPSFSSGYNQQGLNELTLSALRFSDFTSPDIPPKPKQYFKLWLPPSLKWVYVKVRFDRLQLLALLDKNTTLFELLASIFLAILVAILASIVISCNVFQDVPFFIFCFVIAGSQYTLLKSVQPDAASPTHGYNRIIIYSRPIYFSLSCSVILLCHWLLHSTLPTSTITLFRIPILSHSLISPLYHLTKFIILSFPIIFSFGLLPQIDTFVTFLLEHFEIHLFGGSAITLGLSSAFFAFSRSLLSIFFLYLLALLALHRVYFRSLAQKTEFTFHHFDVAFSVFCGILTAFAYLLSRSSSDPTVLFKLIGKCFHGCRRRILSDQSAQGTSIENEGVEMKVLSSSDPGASQEEEESEESQVYEDPLPRKLEETVLVRLQNDLIICIVTTIVVFAVHVSSIFTLQPIVEICLGSIAIVWGILLHYILKQSRKELPWLCFARPFLTPYEHDLFEVKHQPRLMCFERIQASLWFIEKNVIYPLFFLSAITKDTPLILDKFNFFFGTFLIVICGFKAIRSSLNDSSYNYIIVLFTYIFSSFDFKSVSEPFLINYFFASIIFHKIMELLLKVKFVVIYVAPWQITWGSAFHAFAQPFSVPHSGMLLVQAVVSTIFSAPLEPVLGSAIFITSYVRPIKFWERDYNTKRVDHSNTRLASQLDRNQLGSDDNNLNSIFYEHLTRSLQTYLYGDLALGRWGQVSSGDCFVLASDNLNCLVHIIELANGLVTFQVRGLEFRGTYCQQREVEALSEGVSEDDGCCCCEPGHLPRMLSLNAAFNQRWLAWEVTHTKYVLEGYSISENSAISMLQPYDLRKALITYYIKSVIYYTVMNRKVEKWIKDEVIEEALESMSHDKNFIDLDPTFNLSVDEDYDYRSSGITRTSFCKVYLAWIKYCLAERSGSGHHQSTSSGRPKVTLSPDEEHKLVSLCFALSLLARRALSAASHHNSFTSVEFLLYGLHALFKGDFRITSARDEWVFQDMDLLKQVIAPSVRMAVKLHQDHFMSADEYDDLYCLFISIDNYDRNIVISHEADPVWRNAILSNVDSLLALRHVFDEGSDRYKFVMLNKRFLSFRLIKINKECVRGLWAGQQQELIYLRNRNPERGSIQNAKQALRNIINSSCDQPIGYPIYVSPLTTSFAETSQQLAQVIGRPFSFSMFKVAALRWWTRTKLRFDQGYPPALDDELPPTQSDSFSSAQRHHRHRETCGFSRGLSETERSSRTSHRSLKIESVHRPHRRHQKAVAGGSLGGGSRAYNSGQAIYKQKSSSLTRGRNSPSPLSSSTHVTVSAARTSVSGLNPLETSVAVSTARTSVIGTNPLETSAAGTSASVDIESGSRGSSSIVYHRANVSAAVGVSSSQPSAASSAGHGKAGGSRGSPPSSSTTTTTPPSSSTTTTASRHRSMNL